MQNACSSSQRTQQATVREDPCDTITAAPDAGVFGFSSPAPICEHMTAHDVQRAKILNKRVIGDWQLRVPATRRETTEPEDGTGVSFRSRFVDNPIRFVHLEGCRDARTIVNAMKH